MQEVSFDFWMFLAGLGIFLFGMHHLEDGIKGLAGKSFKNLLRKFTNRSWKGILTGTFVTGILQSSSMVNLLILAFLGAGMISLKNALGVILGANLGTTFTAWIVATLGFKVNVADFSYPFLALGILSYLFLKGRPVIKNIGLFLIGFGLLFLGLDFMKDAMEAISDSIDMNIISQHGLWAFLLIGLIITALIQSSSAMIVIVLSALNSDLIDIYQSIALIIGANIGTTSTLILGSFGGTADKKRLALANVFFNLVAGLLAFAFLWQAVDVLVNVFKLTDTLMELVILNTVLNLFGIILFFPFLGLFQRFLKNRFKVAEPVGATLYIKNVPTNVPDVAIKAIQQELVHLYNLTKDFILKIYNINPENSVKTNRWLSIFKVAKDPNENYDNIKLIEDEITKFYTKLQKHELEINDIEMLENNMSIMRSFVYAAKDIKDVQHNIRTIQESNDELAFQILERLKTHLNIRFSDYDKMIYSNETDSIDTNLYDENHKLYVETIHFIYNELKSIKKSDIPVSTITNVTKQTIAALNNLYSACKNYCLSFNPIVTISEN
ncbi:Na/Pi cotransporter family protein [Paucihalobacter sp.]|uniref:Na/Pi cotransporter family protein n=1 Tax=Paucihalobacter sp. TaxID=2850405 RepID=UPI002FE2A971